MKRLIILLTLFTLTCAANSQVPEHRYHLVGKIHVDTLRYDYGDDLEDLIVKKFTGKYGIKFKNGTEVGWIPYQRVLPGGFYYMVIIDGYLAFYEVKNKKAKLIEPETWFVKVDTKDKKTSKEKYANDKYDIFRPDNDAINHGAELVEANLNEEDKK